MKSDHAVANTCEEEIEEVINIDDVINIGMKMFLSFFIHCLG
jgi:hypothetical protein